MAFLQPLDDSSLVRTGVVNAIRVIQVYHEGLAKMDAYKAEAYIQSIKASGALKSTVELDKKLSLMAEQFQKLKDGKKAAKGAS